MATEYTKEVTLPSRGIYYPDNPELAGKIKLRMMTTQDEKKIFGSSGDKLTKVLLQNCIVSPAFDPDILVGADRQYLFMQLRIFTYGDDYHVRYQCPFCNGKGEVKINLTNDLVVNELPEDATPTVEVELPVCKSKVVVKPLTVKEADAVFTRAKNFAKRTGSPVGEFDFMFRKVAQLVTIDGKDLSLAEKEKFVGGLVGRDSAFLEAKLGGDKLGYDYLITTECPECGEEIETVFEPTGEFFRPRFD